MNRSSKQLGPLSLRRLRLPTPPVTGKLHHIVFEFHFFLLGSIFYSLPSCYDRFQRRLLVSPLPEHPARHPQALVARKRIHSRQDTRPSVSASILTTIQHRQAGLHAGFQLSGLSFPVRRTFFQRVSSATENRGPPPPFAHYLLRIPMQDQPADHFPMQLGSFREPSSTGTRSTCSAYFLPQRNQDLKHAPLPVQTATTSNPLPMSGYSKNQQYIYGE